MDSDLAFRQTRERGLMKQPIWIVDDDRSIRFVLEKAFQKQGWMTQLFAQAEALISTLENTPQERRPWLILTDIRMPGASGLDLLSYIQQNFSTIQVVIMTAYSDFDSTSASFQAGACEYILKPFDIYHVIDVIKKIANKKQNEEIKEPFHSEVVGRSRVMQAIFRQIARLQSSLSPVLITGESGTGKTLIAQVLHQQSLHAKGPCLVFDPTTVSSSFEDEVFLGIENTDDGPQENIKGELEKANKGTLIIKDVAHLSLTLQARLLSLLNASPLYRVNGKQALDLSVRVIAITSDSLEAKVKEGAFRQDLYYRLTSMHVHMPALRERVEDIEGLAHFFFKASSKELKVVARVLSAAALKKCTQFEFLGNVRQLKNICYWLTVMTPHSVIEVQDLPVELLNAEKTKEELDEQESSFWREALQKSLSLVEANHAGAIWPALHQQLEKELITVALNKSKGRVIAAASWLGIGRNTMTRKMQELDIDIKEWKAK